MSRHGTPTDGEPAWSPYEVRGRPLYLTAHAVVGMDAERPPVGIVDVLRALEEPDHDDGKEATKWVGRRTIKVYYSEEGDRIYVRGISATRRRFHV